MFKQHSNSSYLLLLLLIGFVWSCNVEQISSDLDPTDITSRMEDDGCRVRIVGNVVSTQDLLGLEGATISSEQFTDIVQTNDDGSFEIDLFIEQGQSLSEVDVEVALDGFITNTFPVDLSDVIDLSDCSPLTTFAWDIGLTPLEEGVEVRNDRPTEIVVEDTVAVVIFETDDMGNIIGRDTVQQVNKYRIEIPKVIASQPSVISITANQNFAYGAGIVRSDENRAEIGQFHFETTEGTQLNGKISIIFQSQTSIETGDVIEFSNDRSYIVGFDTNSNVITILTGSFEDLTIFNGSNLFVPGASSGLSGAAAAAVGLDNVSNCNCGDAITYVYNFDLNRNQQVSIDFPAGTPQDVKDAVLNDLIGFLGVSGSGAPITTSASIVVDKCEQLSISTTPTGIVETGEIYGYPYTFSSVTGGVVNISTSDCPTTTACHQGCP